MDKNARDRLVIEHLPLVGYIVSDLMARATHLDRAELASAGQFALVKAALAYEPERGVPFAAYARTRITGALADELRSQDWATRGTRQKLTRAALVRESLTSALGREPSNEELGEAMGLDRKQVADLLASNTGAPISIFDAVEPATDFIGPEESAEVRERDDFIRKMVDGLPERLRNVIDEIYFKERRVQDIAAELGVSHVAVSQARKEAVGMLHDALKLHFDSSIEHEVAAVRPGTRRADYLASFQELSSPAKFNVA